LIDAMLAHPILMNRPGVGDTAGHQAVPPFGRVLSNPAQLQRARTGQGGRQPVKVNAQGRTCCKNLDVSALPQLDAAFKQPAEWAERQPSWPTAAHLAALWVGGERSFNRLASEEAARYANHGLRDRTFDPRVACRCCRITQRCRELRDLAAWAEGMWCSPERRSAMTGIWSQIDWIPLNWARCADSGQNAGELMGVSGSQSFNAVSQMRILGRWMRSTTI
jgi:arsenic resistance protein ArsH